MDHVMNQATDQAAVGTLRKTSDAARERLGRQLQGMEAHLERTHAPGQWTAREVLCHLLGEPGADLGALLDRFSATEPPLVEIVPGQVTITAERRRMTLAGLLAALDAQRAAVLGHLATLQPDDFGRKARIPLFAPILGTEKVTLPVFVGAMLGMHWDAHADQIGQIRRAVGLTEAEYTSPAR
jgi:hypothetical protein